MGLVTIAGVHGFWPCQRDDCLVPLELYSPAYQYDLADPLATSTRPDSLCWFIHGDGDHAPARAFTGDELLADALEGWIMAVHAGDKDAGQTTRKDIPAIPPRDAAPPPPQPRAVPVAPGTPDPRRVGPVPSRRVPPR